MKSDRSCLLCKIIGIAALCVVSGIILVIFMTSWIIIITDYPDGFSAVFDSSGKHYGSLITGGMAAFSSIIVLTGVLLTIRDQHKSKKQKRKQKLKSVIHMMPNIFDELSILCTDYVLIIKGKRGSKDYHEYCLSQSSIDTIKFTIEYLRGDECESLCKVFAYYQIAIRKFKFEMSALKNKEMNTLEAEKAEKRRKELIVELISLKSIAEVCVNSALRGRVEFCLSLCKRQFRDNMLKYDKLGNEGKYLAEDIASEFSLEYSNTLNIFVGDNIGFFDENYFDKFRIPDLPA